MSNRRCVGCSRVATTEIQGHALSCHGCGGYRVCLIAKGYTRRRDIYFVLLLMVASENQGFQTLSVVPSWFFVVVFFSHQGCEFASWAVSTISLGVPGLPRLLPVCESRLA